MSCFVALRLARRLVGPALLVLLLWAGLPIPGRAAPGTDVWQSKDDFVRIEPADGPALAPPAAVAPLSPDAVHAVLASIKLTGEGGDTPFLDDEQLALISEPVARALRSAGANQDVVFAVHYVSVMSLLGPPKTTAGRLFAEGDGIGVILGQVQSTYVRNYVSLDRSLIRTGARGAAQETRFHIVPGGAVSLVQSDRGDRAHISPLAWTGTYGMPPLSAPAAPAAPVAPAAPALYAPPTAPTAPVAAPPPPPPPAAPAALLAVPPPSDPLQIEQRFAALKRLLDAQLISPADYDKAKAELLQAISTLPPR